MTETSEPATRRFSCPAGEVTALVDGAVVRARGIRYATAERFAVPRPVAEGEQIDARHPAPYCPQPVDPPPGLLRIDGLAGLTASEDCLRVSVTLPADADDAERLPVMVWIHGGAYRGGAADSPVYDPATLVREQRVIVVSVGYRLGPLGYLAARGVPANLGLLDQLLALRWVRRNIAGFGGDPGQVTAFGESAGADAVAHLMISDGVLTDDGPLFVRAIIQSAPFGTTAGRSALGTALAELVPTIAEDVDETGEIAASALAELDAQVLRIGTRHGTAGTMPYGIQYGHAPLPNEADAEAAWRRIAPHIDVLAGTTTREIALYRDIPPLQRLRGTPVIGLPVGAVVTETLTRTLTATIFTRPTTTFVRRHQHAGGRARRYVLDWRADNPLAAAHASDMPLLFPAPIWQGSTLLDNESEPAVAELGRPMRRMWADFARTGIPDDTGVTVLSLTD